jgi:ABC-2 type transport system ATP-binding protein
MIDIKDLYFSYRGEPLFQALRLELAPGNIYGLLGMNGAGKSTLLRLATGLLFARGGSLRSLGRDPAKREPGLLSQVFMLPEELNVPSVTDREYLRARAPFYPRFDHDRFARYVREFELPQGRKLTAMSHGQQKKFLLSFGLASESALLLLDEPTNCLDIPSKGQFRRAIAEAATPERLFVISTHQVRDVDALIDPIVVLHRGRVVLNHSLAEIGSRIRMERTSSPPDPHAPHLLYSESAVGGFWSVWDNAGADDEQLDLEVLFNALVAQPERLTSVFSSDGARA